MARMIDADRLLRELTALSHGQVWPGWTYDGIRLLIERQPTLTPPNEPLALEDLREMDGEPVWCKELKSWALIYTEDGKWEPHLILPDLSPVINFPVKTHNRTYTLYRRPPEGEV